MTRTAPAPAAGHCRLARGLLAATGTVGLLAASGADGGEVLAAASAAGGGAVAQCPGSLEVAGADPVALVATQWNLPGTPAGPVSVLRGAAVPDMWGRAYFAETCTDGSYNYTQYVAWQLLGRRLTYTTDVSQAGCGCNAALYLVSMRQNPEVSGCEDFYCDANSICGPSCAEIDIQESNRYAWHSTLHTAWDGLGEFTGYGGSTLENRSYDFNASQYGPGAACVNTDSPFQVSAAFPVDEAGASTGMAVTLSQHGCSVGLELESYAADPSFEELTRALQAGMTPVVSYWKSPDMLWLDGPGPLGEGPCRNDDVQLCTAPPSFYDFRIEDL